MTKGNGATGDGASDSGIHFVPDLIAVAVQDPLGEGGQQVEELADSVGGSVVGADDLEERFGFGDDAEQDADEPTTGGRLAGLAGFIGGVEPLSAARRIVDSGVDASPVYAMGYQWHKAFTELPVEDVVKDFDHEKIRADNDGRIIAMVDSGLVKDGLPDWLSRNVDAPKIDEEVFDGNASHGTFVASILRQGAQGHQVYVARADRIRGPLSGPDDGAHRGQPLPTTDAHVSAAILRLIDRILSSDGQVDALNISVGGPAHNISGRAMVLLRQALDRWFETFPESLVFAAAGNSDEVGKVFPAAFPDVKGVAAGNSGNQPIAWVDRDGERLVPYPKVIAKRNWVSIVEPGMGVAGLTGDGDEVRRWSGSSFAAAIASARYAETKA